MARQNTVRLTSRTTPLKSEYSSTARTATGGQGFVSDSNSELFRLGVNGLLGKEETYHESGKSRDSRFTDLVSELAVNDPGWTAGFLTWLRGPEANIRTASLIGAADYVHARLAAGVKESGKSKGFNRTVVDGVCQRADEPGELASIYLSEYGKLPKPVKRGLGDAASRLWNPYATMKYDTASHGLRFADVMNLSHFTLADNELAAHIINRRYGNDEDWASLPEMVKNNISLRKEVAKGNYDILTNSRVLKSAGMTWEDALSLAGNHVPKDKLWNALILGGQVPIFAALRNLRNFTEAGISQQAKEYIHDQLTNEIIIAKSRILPFRFLSALEAQDSYEWYSDLETAVQIATRNVPRLEGKTIVLVDTSGSMDSPVSNKSKMTRSGLAAFFGGAFAAHNSDDVALYIYADGVKRIPVKKGHSVLKLAEEMHRRTGEVGHGTQTGRAMRQACSENPDAKRLIDNTDMQSFAHGSRAHVLSYSGFGFSSYNSNGYSRQGTAADVPDSVFLYSNDLSGYKTANVQTGDGSRTHQLSGMMGDSTYKWMKAIEAGTNADWPWLKK